MLILKRWDILQLNPKMYTHFLYCDVLIRRVSGLLTGFTDILKVNMEKSDRWTFPPLLMRSMTLVWNC